MATRGRLVKRPRRNYQSYDPGTFFTLRNEVVASPQFRALKDYTRTLILAVNLQYDGCNNGMLMATESLIVGEGWLARSTWRRAVEQAVDTAFLLPGQDMGYGSELEALRQSDPEKAQRIIADAYAEKESSPNKIAWRCGGRHSPMTYALSYLPIDPGPHTLIPTSVAPDTWRELCP